MDATPTSLADRLMQARLRTALGQDAVAKAVGMSQPSYSALETGKSKATTKIGSLAHVLQVDAYWLETGQGEMEAGAKRAADGDSPAYAGAASSTALSAEEAVLLKVYRAADRARRKALVTLLAG